AFLMPGSFCRRHDMQPNRFFTVPARSTRLKGSRLTFPVTAFSALVASTAAVAEPQPTRQDVAGQPLQLAQAYEFDVYIDQYGREIVVDPHTGRVVEIRPPLAEPPPPPPPPSPPSPRAEGGDRGWRSYD